MEGCDGNFMTTHELAKMLLEGEDVAVVVSGYEGGVNDLNQINYLAVHRDVNDAWYYGKHELCNGDCWHDGFGPTEKACFIR
jgi:hypothetical protein